VTPPRPARLRAELNHRFFTASKAASCKDPRDR